ncbi:hypothetical protein F5141DRAFT_1064527 [Pisolithus sp. B1]|nr:hypothetical protein F5141DRAFT_1064527 [Pisolithus sp. B1]
MPGYHGNTTTVSHGNGQERENVHHSYIMKWALLQERDVARNAANATSVTSKKSGQNDLLFFAFTDHRCSLNSTTEAMMGAFWSSGDVCVWSHAVMPVTRWRPETNVKLENTYHPGHAPLVVGGKLFPSFNSPPAAIAACTSRNFRRNTPNNLSLYGIAGRGPGRSTRNSISNYSAPQPSNHSRNLPYVYATRMQVDALFLPVGHVRVPTPLVYNIEWILCQTSLLLITRGGFFGNALHVVARPGTRERFCGSSGILFESYLHRQE